MLYGSVAGTAVVLYGSVAGTVAVLYGSLAGTAGRRLCFTTVWLHEGVERFTALWWSRWLQPKNY